MAGGSVRAGAGFSRRALKMCPMLATIVRAFALPASLLIAGAAAGGCGGYEWTREAEGLYYASERGRLVPLVAVSVRGTGSPFESWNPVLVEPCEGREQGAAGGGAGPPDGMPCWPPGGRGVTQGLLATLALEMPQHRNIGPLLDASAKLNREIGTGRTAYILGTHPLVIAYLDERPDAAAYRQLAGPQPWPPQGKGVDARRLSDGSWDVYDPRERDARLVGETNLLDVQANVVLHYPEELDLKAAESVPPRLDDPHLKARLLVMREPRPLLRLMRDVAAGPAALEAAAAITVEVPIR